MEKGVSLIQRKSRELLEKFFVERRRVLRERPRIFREYISKLAKALGEEASLIVFGGRARVGLESHEPPGLRPPYCSGKEG